MLKDWDDCCLRFLKCNQTACADFPTGVVAPARHASRRQRALPSSRHPQRPHNGVVCCCVQHTAYSARVALLCIVDGDDSAFLRFCPRWPWPLTFDFDIRTRRDFCTMHLTAKFHHPTFNRSEVIVRTNWQTKWQTNKQTPLKTSTSLRYATPVGNNVYRSLKHRCLYINSNIFSQ